MAQAPLTIAQRVEESVQLANQAAQNRLADREAIDALAKKVDGLQALLSSVQATLLQVQSRIG